MRKFAYVLIALLILIVLIYFYVSNHNDNSTNNNNLQDNTEKFSFKKHIAKYEVLKKGIMLKQNEFRESYNKSLSKNDKKRVLNDTKRYLVDVITNDVFKFWYGTKWSYDGTTETPLSGDIACGYFVSTVLVHSGFNLDRYTLAKQPSSLIVKSLCHKSTIKTFNNVRHLTSYFEDNSNSLYILGLDNHVGFVFKHNESIYFIHSSYTRGRSVTKEILKDSDAINSSKLYVVGNLLDNIQILDKWLKGERIKIITM